MNNRQVRVFLSFEFGKDEELHRNFYAQAEAHSTHEIIDYSLDEPYQPNALWLNKARKQITQSDIVIVVIGDDTHNAAGVEKEVTVANQLDKPMFQIRPQQRTSGEVKGAGEVVSWKWKQIDAMITQLLST